MKRNALVKRPAAAVKQATPSMLDTLFAGGCTAVFLVILASVAGTITLYFR